MKMSADTETRRNGN